MNSFLSAVAAVILAFVILLVVLGVFVLLSKAKRRWKLRQKEKKLARLLSGQSLDDILAESPYQYAHFQGEDGYRLFDVRNENEFIDFATNLLDAHLWVVERYLAEKDRG